ncbi:uncharacterized protein LOC123207902 isoform X2 [Mangifera indica]|uniref:uncharacterized protein LOC123207902 isoform X2 n=1 Tax=Mangifera indica TaxID=29780 RepID=UPI001CFB4BCF|nr:uncharacterized protein LOC123207902 isoform X2 [Mangifera indica]
MYKSITDERSRFVLCHSAAKEMAEAEETMMELAAVQAVYGEDCVILNSYPPHLHLHIKPRTANVSSQQFVEAVIGIRAGPKYPDEAPSIDLIESKGLDQQRQKDLISSIQDKGCELSSDLMLVALCEESVEKLSSMNHPDGNCPLCLYPLVPKDENDEVLPFMKLMSCFHCFHGECIVHWWNWLQKEKEDNASCGDTLHPIRVMRNERALEENIGNCPVCRKVFHAKDLEHVLNLVGSQSSQLRISDVSEVDDNDKLLQSDSENMRKQKFEAIQKLQQERNGLIEPKKELVVLPGMFLSQPAPSYTATTTKETTEQELREPPLQEPAELPAPLERNRTGASNRPGTSRQWNSGMRKPRASYPRKQKNYFKQNQREKK